VSTAEVIARNKAIIVDFIAALGSGDMDAVAAFLTVDCTWYTVSGRKDLSRDEVLGAIRWVNTQALKAPVRQTVLSMTAEEDRVAVMLDGHAETIDGVPYENMYHLLFQLREGKLCKAWEFNDTRHAWQVLRRGEGGELGLGDALDSPDVSTSSFSRTSET
jgi:ketosteroid isomerase-like protein